MSINKVDFGREMIANENYQPYKNCTHENARFEARSMVPGSPEMGDAAVRFCPDCQQVVDASFSNAMQLNNGEAIMGFLAWLTMRDTPVTFSIKHEAGVAVRLFDLFAKYNRLETIRGEYYLWLNHPPQAADIIED